MATHIHAMPVLRLPRGTLREQIADRIKQHILTANLQPGDRLPTERELTHLLGVSRTSLREALKSLETIGLVECRPKQGITVKEPDMKPIQELLWARVSGNEVTVTDTWEVRRLIEVAVLPLVAERATDEDWRRLEEAVKTMEAAVEAGDLGLEGDVLFHHALFEACHNPVLRSLREVVAEFFRKIQQMALSESLAVRRNAAKEHRLMLQVLRRGNVRQAQRLMEKHIEGAVERGVIPRRVG